ncbi:hypothetical protein AArcSl_2292 [Halalkaliarchaeum desulfuricum]|uniref:Endonuclease NucS C-terminal domain-containing protein n=2 Tax=Halalkaliarchaeum desulfuricum TaxID=2055893 RepID=A0A343TLE3_9EURY|nr:hypothetical protein AArcSl_2292 [Halalkaliarchaeum desulfuricum]
MEVYLVEQDDMKRVPESELDTEANLEQRLVRTDGAKIGEVEVLYVGRQGSPGEGGIFDILGVDERGDTVIVELKRDRAPRDIVAQALEYASEIRNVDYEYLDDQYRQFLREEQGHTEPNDILSLREAHCEYFDLDDVLSKREFNNEQRLVVVGTDFQDVSLNMADFLREHGVDVVAVEYSTYRDENKGIELLTTDGVRRPLSEEPTGTVTSTSDSEDYSELIIAVRDHVFPQVKDELHFEDAERIAKPTHKRSIGFGSDHPEHPGPLKYGMQPRIEEQGLVRFRVNLWNAEPAQHEELRQFLASHAESLDGYTLAEDDTQSMGILTKDVEVDGDEIEVSEMAQELVDLIDYLHPRAIEEYADHELFG